MATITAGLTVGSYVAGRYAQRHALTAMMITGRVLACFGLTAGLTFYAAGIVIARTVDPSFGRPQPGTDLTDQRRHIRVPVKNRSDFLR